LFRSVTGVVALLFLLLAPSVYATHTVVGPNVRVTLASNTAAQAEVVVAANPNNDANLVAGYMEMQGTNFQLAHAKSTDRGTTWQSQALFSLTGYNKFVDPAVAFNTGGTPYFVGLAETAGLCFTDDHSSCNASLIISKSTDSGTTWTAPNVFRPATCSNGSGAYHDKPSMKVDTSASPNGGKIYASWTRIDGCPIATDPLPATSVMVTRLTDTGSSFTQDVETRVGGASGGNTNTQVVWSDVALAPNGDVYVGWVQITRAPSPLSERITVAKSTDGGQTFTTLSFPANFAPFVVDALHPPSFEIDVDPSVPNLVYLVYEDSSVNSGDIKFRRSTDGGVTWSNLLTVNTNTAGIQSFPSMSVVAGRINIIWYDGRDFYPLNDKVDTYFAKSLDNGQTFVSPDIRINSESIPTGGSTLGDYVGIWSSTFYSYAIWTGKLPGATDNRDPILDLLSFPDQGGSGGGGSVAHGTLITMADGTRIPVQNLAAGDHVVMYDVYRRTSLTATITSIPHVTVDNMLTIYTEDGMPLRVDANPKLKFYVWTLNGPILKPVTDFQPGDLLYNYDHAKWVPITRVEISYGGSHVYYDLLTDPYLTVDRQYLNFIANGYADPCNPICKEGP